jgi:hypothetical protein
MLGCVAEIAGRSMHQGGQHATAQVDTLLDYEVQSSSASALSTRASEGSSVLCATNSLSVCGSPRPNSWAMRPAAASFVATSSS